MGNWAHALEILTLGHTLSLPEQDNYPYQRDPGRGGSEAIKKVE